MPVCVCVCVCVCVYLDLASVRPHPLPPCGQPWFKLAVQQQQRGRKTEEKWYQERPQQREQGDGPIPDEAEIRAKISLSLSLSVRRLYVWYDTLSESTLLYSLLLTMMLCSVLLSSVFPHTSWASLLFSHTPHRNRQRFGLALSKPNRLRIKWFGSVQT